MQPASSPRPVAASTAEELHPLCAPWPAAHPSSFSSDADRDESPLLSGTSPAGQLDDTVPPGSSAVESFLLMQQARIDALESDVVQIQRERQQEQEQQQQQLQLQLQLRELPHSDDNTDDLDALPAGAFGIWVAPPAAPPAPRRLCRPSDGCLLLWSVLACALCTSGYVCVFLAAGDVYTCNTPASALVTGTSPSWAPACSSNITFPSHGGATQSVTVLLEEADGGGCPQVDSHVPVCYYWQEPATDVCVGDCDTWFSYHTARALLTAGTVLGVVGIAVLLPLFLRSCVIICCPADE